MDSAKGPSTNLTLGDVDGTAEWLCWRSADLKSLPVAFGSGYEFGQTAPDKEIAAQAVAFVVNSSRKGIVSLCADVASLMRARRSLEERLMARESDTPSRLSGDAAACCGLTTRSNSLSSSAAAAAAAHRDVPISSGGSSSSSFDVGPQRVCKEKDGSSASAEAGHQSRTCGGCQCQRSADRPPLQRQASIDSSSDQQWSCSAIACSGGCTVDSSCPAAGCAGHRLSADGSSLCSTQGTGGAGAPSDEHRHGCLPQLPDASGTATAAAAAACGGEGGQQPALPTCSSPDRCCLHECHAIRVAELHCVAARSCCTSDDEATPLSTSRSRGVQVSLQLSTAEGAAASAAVRCSSCHACDERLSDAMKVNRRLQQQLSAAQRELSSLRAKLVHTSVVAPDQVPSSTRSRQVSPVNVTSPTALSVAVIEHRGIGSRRGSVDACVTQSAATTEQAAAVSINDHAASVERSSSGERTDVLPAEARNGRSSPISKAVQREKMSELSESGGGSSSSSSAASPALSAWGALGKLGRLIKGASAGRTMVLSESGSSTRSVRLNDEVLTTGNQRGIVRYVGKLDTHHDQRQNVTTYVGLQLYEPAGTHDGTYEGKRYFSCEQNHGVFVALQDIKPVTSRKRILRLKLSGSSDGGRSCRSEESEAQSLARSSRSAGPASDDGISISRSSRAGAAAATVTVRSRSVAAAASGHNGERRSTLPTLLNWTVSLDKHRRPPSTEHVSSA